MNNKLKINLISIIIIILMFLIGRIASRSPIQERVIYISISGFMAMLSMLFVVSIPIIYMLKRSNFTAILATNRRWIGIYTFIFALIHVLLVSRFIFNWNMSEIFKSAYLILGGTAFAILLLMAITSNNKSMRLLKKNWKRLHYLIYVALILVVVHSSNRGLVFMKNMVVKVLIVSLALVIIIWKIRDKFRKNGKKSSV